jgi:hypothetical protein
MSQRPNSLISLAEPVGFRLDRQANNLPHDPGSCKKQSGNKAKKLLANIEREINR